MWFSEGKLKLFVPEVFNFIKIFSQDVFFKKKKKDCPPSLLTFLDSVLEFCILLLISNMNSWLSEQSIDFSLRLYTIVNVLLSTQVESKRPKNGGVGRIFWLYWDGLQGLFRKMSHIGAFAVTVSCWYWLWSKMSWHQLLGVGLAPVLCRILST